MSMQVTTQDGSQAMRTFLATDGEMLDRMEGAMMAGARSVACHRPGAEVTVRGRPFVFQGNGKWKDLVTGGLVDDPVRHMANAL